MADASDLKSAVRNRRGGSNPPSRTNYLNNENSIIGSC